MDAAGRLMTQVYNVFEATVDEMAINPMDGLNFSGITRIPNDHSPGAGHASG